MPAVPDDFLAALSDFAERLDALDPDAPSQGELTVRLSGEEIRLTLRTPVARALVEALRRYHDPRDLGRCDHCGGARLDENFLCRDCGGLSGVFGQLVAERVAGHTEPAALSGPAALSAGRGRHARADD